MTRIPDAHRQRPATSPRTCRVLIVGSRLRRSRRGDPADPGGRRDFLVVERGSDGRRHLARQHLPRRGLRRALAPVLVLASSSTRLVALVLAAAGDPGLPAHVTADKYGVLRPASCFDTEVDAARAGTSDARRWPVDDHARRRSPPTSSSPAVGALCRARSCPTSRASRTSRARSSTPRAGTTTSTSPASGSRVIGTGASAIQIVPGDRRRRSATSTSTSAPRPWVMPRHDRAYRPLEKLALPARPGAAAARARGDLLGPRVLRARLRVRSPRSCRPRSGSPSSNIAKAIDDPAAARRGHARLADRLQAHPDLQRPGTRRWRATTSTSSPTASPRSAPNAIVTARRHRARGRRDHRRHRLPRHRLADVRAHHRRRRPQRWPRCWREHGQQAYKGAAVTGFPNLMFLIGPNTGLGHSSMVYMVESHDELPVQRAAQRWTSTASPPSTSAPTCSSKYNDELQQRMRRTIWTTGGCASWYLDEHGNNTTLWPSFTFVFRR